MWSRVCWCVGVGALCVWRSKAMDIRHLKVRKGTNFCDVDHGLPYQEPLEFGLIESTQERWRNLRKARGENKKQMPS